MLVTHSRSLGECEILQDQTYNIPTLLEEASIIASSQTKS